jgi:hypothetical protein
VAGAEPQRQVHRPGERQPLAVRRAEVGRQQVVDRTRRERLAVGLDQLAVDPQHRRLAGDEQQVAGTAAGHLGQQRLERSAGDLGAAPQGARARGGRGRPGGSIGCGSRAASRAADGADGSSAAENGVLPSAARRRFELGDELVQFGVPVQRRHGSRGLPTGCRPR